MTKRIFELNKGDVFILYGLDCIVQKRENGKLYYKVISDNGKLSSLGGKSQQKVQMVSIMKEPDTIKELRRNMAVYSNVKSLYAK